jgi:phosphoribosylglycinamide formyltransferase-1
MSERRRIAILASGNGSNMEAIAAACESGEVPGDIALIISNQPNAGVLVRARERGLPACCIPHRDYPDRQAFEAAMLAVLADTAVDVVVLAGFMRILTDGFIREYYGSLLNIHPSLLPKYPGLDTHQRALDAGDREAGTTVHFVTPVLDAGPAIIQARVPVQPGDNAASLAARVQEAEHRIYPLALRWFLEGRVELRNGQTWKDESIMNSGAGE